MAESSIIFLAQSDTTAGFLSENPKALNALKERDLDKKILREVCNLKMLKHLCRTPKKHRNLIRRAKKTSFILPCGEAFRVIKDARHNAFLRHFGALYSTSANISGQGFCLEWAAKKADVIILDSRGIYEGKASKIYKLSRKKIQKMRG